MTRSTQTRRVLVRICRPVARPVVNPFRLHNRRINQLMEVTNK